MDCKQQAEINIFLSKLLDHRNKANKTPGGWPKLVSTYYRERNGRGESRAGERRGGEERKGR